jgi:hypothetical protein
LGVSATPCQRSLISQCFVLGRHRRGTEVPLKFLCYPDCLGICAHTPGRPNVILRTVPAGIQIPLDAFRQSLCGALRSEVEVWRREGHTIRRCGSVRAIALSFALSLCVGSSAVLICSCRSCLIRFPVALVTPLLSLVNHVLDVAKREL